MSHLADLLPVGRGDNVFAYFWQVGLLNVDGYYNILLSFIDKAVDEGFISFSARRIIVSAPTAAELIRELEVPTSPSYCKIVKFYHPTSSSTRR